MPSFQDGATALPVPISLPAVNRWPADVEVWHVALDLDAESAAFCGFLAADEVARMTRYARPADRIRFATARALLRAMLGERLGCDPLQLAFTQGTYGRPSLAAHPGVSFNVSHSGARVLIALSMQRTVGVDIEVDDAMLDWRALLDLVCAPEEARTILCARAFYRCWTAKEALLKATGEGIGRGLKSIDLSSAWRPAALRVVHLDELAGYSGALAFGPPTPLA
ncbi:MAG: 4'-phosphopantetheinyl transferase family protein [Janthinobacterium lividum]